MSTDPYSSGIENPPEDDLQSGGYCRTCGGTGVVGFGPEPEDYGPCPDCASYYSDEGGADE